MITEDTPKPAALMTEEEIENCIDAANRNFNGRRQGPCGQQLTAYDDWKHWLAREIEAAAVAKERELAVRVLADVLERSGAAKLDATREDDARLLLKLARERA